MDGLEYDLVKKWNLSYLLQTQHGKTIVPLNRVSKRPYTPEVWGSFLTGKEIRLEETSFPAKVIILRIKNKIRRRVKFDVSLGRGKFNTLMFPTLRFPTFLEKTKSIEINAPYHSFGAKELKKPFVRLGRGESLGELYVRMKEIYVLLKERILTRTLSKPPNIDLIFAYLHFPDSIHHIAINKPQIIKHHYEDLNEFARRIAEVAPLPLLIVSDHGFKGDYHSTHGFFSSSIPIKPKPRKITDFFKIITEWKY